MFKLACYNLIFLFLSVIELRAQSGLPGMVVKTSPGQKKIIQRCSTTEYYDSIFKVNPEFKARFEANQRRLNEAMKVKSLGRTQLLTDTIAVVVHVIAGTAAQSTISDIVLASQMDVLNEDYSGRNADTGRIPASFKPLAGRLGLTFKLAQTDPFGAPTTGIERRTNNAAINYDQAKSFATGGLDAWDPTQYINIWVIDMGASGLLGISVFPGDPRPLNQHGVVVDYRAFGKGGSYLYPAFNQGRTVSHEIGHFFNLYHIWGDDGGACTGTDFPSDAIDDDTPNQADHTFGDPDLSGTGTVVTDACSTAAPGIMYQNYMDYTDDVDMVMFTKGQVGRMLTAITTSPDRISLLSSISFRPPVVYNFDARLKSIVNPTVSASFCTNQLTPQVTVRNQGSVTLTSITVNTKLNNGTTVSTPFSVNLATNAEILLTLPTVTAATGVNSLKIFTSLPNGNTDQNSANDTVITTFKINQIFQLSGSVTEQFNSSTFPPVNWDIRNPDNDITWTWNSNFGNSQPGSAWFNDYNNPTNDRHDDLVMPVYSYTNVDSIFLKFKLAAAVYSDPSSTNVPIDTLSVLISKDCGNSFTTVYKKWGNALQTIGATSGYATEFFPKPDQWRTDSVNLGQWLGTSENQVQVTFRFNGNYENNLFLDDVSFYTKVLPLRLKQLGYLVLPTVFQNSFAIWHYQQPSDLNSISVYNSTGQLIWTKQYSGNADKFITVDLTGKSSGIYFLRLSYSDKSKNLTQRVIKN